MLKRFWQRKKQPPGPSPCQLQEIAELRICEQELLHRVLAENGDEWYWNVKLKIAQYCIDRQLKKHEPFRLEKLPRLNLREQTRVIAAHWLLQKQEPAFPATVTWPTTKQGRSRVLPQNGYLAKPEGS